MQQCSLRGCIHPLAPALVIFDFQGNQNGLNDPNAMDSNVLFYKLHHIPCEFDLEFISKLMARKL